MNIAGFLSPCFECGIIINIFLRQDVYLLFIFIFF